jgi:poly-gamma-glutamate synthesis protein (capsule biosynthesis protein)
MDPSSPRCGRAPLAPILVGLLLGLAAWATAGCGGGGASPAGDDEGGALVDDPGALGKADGAGASTAKSRPLAVRGRLAWDSPTPLPAGVAAPAWSFVGAAGAGIVVTAPGAAGIQLYGPRRPGDAWPAPAATVAAGELRATLSGEGLYGVRLEAGAATEITLACSAGDCAPPTWRHPVPEGQLALVAVGDLGLTVSDAPVDREGGWKYGEYHYYFEMLDGFAPYLDGDVNLANLETAVTTGGTKQIKTFVFRMPPEALGAVLDAGFDLLGAANNHTGDYGAPGVVDTVAQLTDVTAAGRLHGFAGAGTGFGAAAAPAVFTVKGVRVAYAACGIGFNVRDAGSGVAHVSDAAAVIAGLAAAPAELRVLSIHAGVELDLAPAADVRAAARKAVDAGIQVVHGHHPHVVQGVEQRGPGVIFYSFGNFELRGARDMGGLDVERDWGLAARLAYDPGSRRVGQIEVLALKDMHRVAVPRTAAEGAARLGKLNARSASLGAGGVRFTVDADTGHGLAQLQ